MLLLKVSLKKNTIELSQHNSVCKRQGVIIGAFHYVRGVWRDASIAQTIRSHMVAYRLL